MGGHENDVQVQGDVSRRAKETSMRIQPATTTICAFLAAGLSCDSRQPVVNNWSVQKSITVASGTHQGLVQYGYVKTGKNGYIAFTMRRRPEEVKGIVEMGDPDSYLTKPSGQIIKLPADRQLFECIDGQFAESAEGVDKSVLDAFLASSPKEYTIKALLSFGEKAKKPNKQQ